MRRERLTKIVATIGPASSAPALIEQLVTAGVDVFRLNFSHGRHDDHAASIASIRAASRRQSRPVGILQDLSGPKIRTGRLQGGRPVELRPGARFRIVTGDIEGGPDRVSTTYAPLAASVKPGDRLLVDDGFIELRVEASDGQEIVTTVVEGGLLGERKGINAPGVALPPSSLTPKDVADLAFGIAHGVDIVALSFVQSGDDLRHARDAARSLGAPALPIIAKIERPEALARLDDVLDACDGVMVARGDLGLEIPLEQVPRAQREITRAALARGLPVIIATQVFDSMRVEPRPTRAEVSDAAHAVGDLVDAIMLSGETAVGAHPVRAVRTLDAVIREAEAMGSAVEVDPTGSLTDVVHNRALCEAALTLARAAGVAALVAVTRRGTTARVLSALRPRWPVVTLVPDERLASRLTLHRNILPLVVADGAPERATAPAGGHARLSARDIERVVVENRLVDAGDVIVVVSVDADLSQPDANYLWIRRVAG